jgi:N-acetylglucosaminyl-diphospho-decaprenol L-rhamnosyltransferase
MKLLTCLLNWRTADMTLAALEAVLPQLESVGDARVCVVDNDSSDGSFEAIVEAVAARGWGDRVDVVQSGYNGGFGYGNNVALRRGLLASDRPDYFYLLNSDAVPDEGAVAALLHYMDANPHVGIAGSSIRGFDGERQRSTFRFPTMWSEIDRTARLGVLTKILEDRVVTMPMPLRSTTSVDWVAGASMMLRRSMLEQIGLFDEAFFLYYEETDLCLRARRAGWQVGYVRESSVAHIGGASTGVHSHTVAQKPMPAYVFASRRHYFLKNHGRAALWAANAAHLVAGATFRVRRRLQAKSDPERPREWVDGVLYNFKNP